MIGPTRRDDAASALAAVLAVVADPSLTEHLTAEPLFVVLLLAGPGVLAELFALRIEGVCRCANANDRSARFDVLHEVLHLLVRQVAKPRKDHEQIGRIKRFQARNVALVRIDRAVVADRKEHGALEAVM